MTVMHVLTLRAVAQSMKPAVEMANWLILFMSLQFFCNLQVNDFFLYNVNSANMFSNCLIVIIFRTPVRMLAIINENLTIWICFVFFAL